MKKAYLPMQVSQLGSLADLTQQAQGNPKSGPCNDGINMRTVAGNGQCPGNQTF